jgi:hypothetical protein
MERVVERGNVVVALKRVEKNKGSRGIESSASQQRSNDSSSRRFTGPAAAIRALAHASNETERPVPGPLVGFDRSLS